MRRLKVSLLVLLLASLVALPARAGGWWSSIGLDGQPVGIGESFSLRVAEIMFDSIEEAGRAEAQTFYAYLVREFDEAALDDAMSRRDPGEWWTPLTEPVRAGTVELFGWDANLAKARVRVDVPRVAPGSYSLMMCDEGCDVPLGNLIPSRVDVVPGALAAEIARRLQETEAKLGLALQRARNDLRETRSILRQALAGDAGEAERLRALETRIDDAAKPRVPPWVAVAGWFLAGVAAALLLVTRRRRRPVEVERLIERIPDDARELTTTR